MMRRLTPFQFFEFPWWVYVSLVFSFFGICMGVNYLVKKFNEAKIEERLIRMLQKASTTQSTQVTGPLIAVETSGAARLNSLKTIQQPSPPGISLVFNREENKRRGDPYSLIKPIIPRLSMETINIISPSERTVTSVPLKRVESAHVAKANSSHILTEKVFVKTNEYGNQAVKKTSSTAKSDCYVTQLITVKKNEYGHVSGLGTYSVARKRSDTSELDSEIEDICLSSRESTPSIDDQDKIPIDSVGRTESGSKAEETAPKETIDVTEKVLFQNFYTSRIIRTKTSIVDITVEKQGVTDKKSIEEIDTGCSIKKSVESIISKIALNLKNKNEDSKMEKNAEDTLTTAKQSSSNTGSGRNVAEINSDEKKKSRCSAAKETSSPVQKIESEYIKQTSSDSRSDRVEEHIESAHTVAKQTFSYSCIGYVDENISIKKLESGHIVAKNPTSAHSFERVGENNPVKNVESGHVATKETTSVDSFERVVEKNPVKKVESGHTVIKETTSTHSHSSRTEDNSPVKKVESANFNNKETNSTHSHIEREVDNSPVKEVEPSRVVTQGTISIHSFERLEENIPKVEPGHIAAKETTSHSKDYHVGENILDKDVATKATAHVHSLERVGENITVKKVESGHIAAKETTSSLSKDDRVGENIPDKRSESEQIAAKETILYAGIVPSKQELVSVKKSITLIESRRGDSEKSSSILRTNYKAREYAAIKKLVSGRKTKETVPHTRSNPIVTAPGPNEEDATGRTGAKASPFHIQSGITVRKQSIKNQKAAIATKETLNTRIDDNIAESSVVKMSKAARNAVKAKYSKELVLEEKKEDIESDNSIKKTEDSTVISGTSKTTDNPEEEVVEEPNKSLADKIKELLEDEDFVELKLYKSKPSSKK